MGKDVLEVLVKIKFYSLDAHKIHSISIPIDFNEKKYSVQRLLDKALYNLKYHQNYHEYCRQLENFVKWNFKTGNPQLENFTLWQAKYYSEKHNSFVTIFSNENFEDSYKKNSKCYIYEFHLKEISTNNTGTVSNGSLSSEPLLK